MNQLPVAGIDVGKHFSEMAVLSPSIDVVFRQKILHDSSSRIGKAVELLHKVEKDFAAKPVVIMESTGHYLLPTTLCLLAIVGFIVVPFFHIRDYEKRFSESLDNN